MFFFKKNTKIIAVIQLKGHMANISIFDIIMSNFDYFWKFSLIVLLKVDKNLNVELYCAVLALCLIINLRIKYYE